MKIQVLVENTSCDKAYHCVHGLSLYIETQKHKILFDLGPGKQLFYNAAKMKIDLTEVDIVVISHGHNDHGGSLKSFLALNKKARIYIRASAFEPYYYKVLGFKSYIGLDTSIKGNHRFVFSKDNEIIDEELQLFSYGSKTDHSFAASDSLLIKTNRQYYPDTFLHEQNLLIREKDTYTLLSGCAHSGITGIIEKAEQLIGKTPDTVIGGFHLYHLPVKKEENANYLVQLAHKLKIKNTNYYTCHCTGLKQYAILHREMGERMNYLSTGSILNTDSCIK